MVRLTGVALVTLLVPATALGQRVEIAPLVGWYNPLVEQQFYSRPIASSTDNIVDSLHARVQPAMSVGLNVGLTFEFFGFEASFTTSTTRVRQDRGIPAIPIGVVPVVTFASARTTQATLRFVVHQRLGNRVTGTLSLGPTLVVLAGDAYEPSNLQEKSVFGLSAAARLGMTLGQGLRLEFGVTDYAYQLDFGNPWAPSSPPSVMRSGMQHDLVTSVGLAWAPVR